MPQCGNRRSNNQCGCLTPADDARLRTWAIDIAKTLLPDSGIRLDLADVQFDHGLRIARSTGIWFHHGRGVGGHSSLPLIRLLRDCSHTDAVVWARAWLAAHQGNGICNGAEPDDDADDDGRSAAALAAGIKRAQEYLAELVPIEATPGWVYLLKRGIPGPYPAWIQWLPPNIARLGEGAVAAILQANGAHVGLQLTFVTQDGDKTLIEPVRRTHLTEKTPRSRAATFGELREPAVLARTAKDPNTPPLLICEGAEDVLSLRQALPDHTIVGVPSVGVLAHLTVAPGVRVTVCRDGDPADHPASKALARGVDHLLLQDADVRVTAPATGADSNDIWLSGGAEALHALVEAAAPAGLSLDGEAIRCAKLDAGDYDVVRKDTAARLRVRVGTLDGAVARERTKVVQLAAATDSTDTADEAWQDTIDLDTALSDGLVELKLYVVASEIELAVCVLWAAHAHLVQNTTVRVPRSPRLKLESRLPGSGKTTAAEAISAMCPEPEFLSSYTASSVFRMLQGEHPPTLILDEADRSIVDGEIVTIINAGYRRSTANIRRSVETPDGGWRSERFNTFCAVIIAGIDPAPPTIQDRCIRIMLRRAQASEVQGHLRDGSSPKLLAVRAHLAAWAAGQVELVEPALPEWLRGQPSRTADNWNLLLAIADQAGGRWPDLVRQAAVAELTGEREPSVMERLLASIKACFDAQPAVAPLNGSEERQRKPDDQGRVQTATLLTFLLTEPGEEWNVINRGKPITEYFLKTKLRHLLKPPGSSRWHTNQDDRRVDHRGYERHQFTDAWARYLVPALPPASAPSAPSDTDVDGSEENQSITPQLAGADGLADEIAGADAKFDLPREQSASAAGLTEAGADGADGADELERESAGYEDAFAEVVRQARAKHPAWPTARLAKHLGQPRDRVEAALAGETPA